MYMSEKNAGSDIFCITNRKLCREDFFARISKIAAARPAAVILREKDLSEKEYKELAKKVLKICREQKTVCILHSFPETALELGCGSLHLPLPVLMEMNDSQRQKFPVLGASCHSVEDAVLAERLGCTYITAGHIFDTDCKKGLPGRGLEFLKNVCAGVSIPVYAIGGIAPVHIRQVKRAGAAGACVMSGLMICEDPEDYLQEFKTQERSGKLFAGV